MLYKNSIVSKYVGSVFLNIYNKMLKFQTVSSEKKVSRDEVNFNSFGTFPIKGLEHAPQT